MAMHRPLAVILASVAFAGSGRAAEPQRLGIAEALALAEERNPDFAAVRARADAQDLRRSAASRAWWPRLSLESEVSSTNVPARVFAQKLNRGAFAAADFELGRLNNPDAVGHLGSMVMLEMPVDIAGTTSARAHGEEGGRTGLGGEDFSIRPNPQALGLATAAEIIWLHPAGSAELQEFLPIPVPVHPRVTAPQEARHRLGIRPGLVVGVTMASAPKFRETVSHPGFAQVVEPVLEAEQDFMLIAVGPSEADGGWRLLADRFGDRVRVVGSQADPAVFLDAADIYLNSFPWSSTTAALEGAARQIPVLSMLTTWDKWGWHRVTFYGDFREPVYALADAMRWKVERKHNLLNLSSKGDTKISSR